MSIDRFARYVPTVQVFAARLVLFHQRVSDELGLTPTEFKCFRLLKHLGPLPLTVLAREAGLQIGTVSGLVDRLESAGFVRRQRDETDRRRLVLAACPEASARVDPLYREQGLAMAHLLEEYTDREFELIMRFLAEAGEVLARSGRSIGQREASVGTSAADDEGRPPKRRGAK